MYTEINTRRAHTKVKVIQLRHCAICSLCVSIFSFIPSRHNQHDTTYCLEYLFYAHDFFVCYKCTTTYNNHYSCYKIYVHLLLRLSQIDCLVPKLICGFVLTTLINHLNFGL